MATKQKTTTGKTKQQTKGLSKITEIRKKILNIKATAERSWLELSELVNTAYHKEYFIEWGFEEFSDYCETELEMGYRKAMYFVDIWDKVKEHKIPRAKVMKMGWTKMKDICTVINTQNAKKLLEKAEKISSRDLTEAVKMMRRKDTDGLNLPAITTMTFKMSEAESHPIIDALAEAKKASQVDNDVVALEMICQDWLETQDAVPELVTLDDRLDFIARVYRTALKIDVAGTKKLKAAAPKEKVAEAEEEVDKETKAADKKAKTKAAGKKTPAKSKAKKPSPLKGTKVPNEHPDDLDDLLDGEGDDLLDGDGDDLLDGDAEGDIDDLLGL